MVPQIRVRHLIYRILRGTSLMMQSPEYGRRGYLNREVLVNSDPLSTLLSSSAFLIQTTLSPRGISLILPPKAFGKRGYLNRAGVVSTSDPLSTLLSSSAFLIQTTLSHSPGSIAITYVLDCTIAVGRCGRRRVRHHIFPGA